MSNSPFQAGFQLGVDLENQRKRNELLQMQAEMLKKKGDLENLQIQREQEALNAPKDMLKEFQSTKQGMVPGAPAPLMPDRNPDTDPAQMGGMSQTAKDVLAESVKLPELVPGQVPLNAEDKLRGLMNAHARAAGNPQVISAINAIAMNDPVLGPELKLRALQAKMDEKDMELDYANKKTEFETGQKIRHTNLEKSWDWAKDQANRKLDIKQAGDTGGFVVFNPYSDNFSPVATFMPDPKNPNEFIHQDLRGQPAYNVVEALLHQLPGIEKKSPEEIEKMIRATQKNPKAYNMLVSGIGKQRAEQATKETGALIQPSQPQPPKPGALDFLWGLLKPSTNATPNAQSLPEGKRFDQIRNDLYALRPDLAPAKSYEQIKQDLLASRSTTNSPWNPQMESGRTVLSELANLYNKLKGIRGGGAENADEFGFPQGRQGQESETPQDSPTERFSKAGIVMNLARTTTLGKASAELSRVFPELSQQQILRILAPVTRNVGTGSGTDSSMVDLEALRQNIGDLYARSGAGYVRRAIPHGAADSLRRLIPKGQ